MSFLTLLTLLTQITQPMTPQPTAASPFADVVLIGGAVHTVDPGNPAAEAVAVQDGTLLHVGDDAGALALAGPETRIIDLGGRMLLPGFHDSHIHLLEAHHEALGTCYLPSGVSPESHIARIQNCAPDQVGTDWVVGFGHSILDLLLHLENGGRLPIEILDEAVPDRPAVFMEETSHSVWANSLALAAAGIGPNTPDPPGGVILREPDTGEINGILLDGAGELVMGLAMAPNAELEQLNFEAILTGMEALARNGITSISDARVYWQRGYLSAWQRAERQGVLTARVTLGLWAYPHLDDDDQIATLASFFSDDPGSRLRANQIKIYADGELNHTTATLLEPYLCCELADPLGLEYFGPTRLARYVRELGAVGFDFFIHAIGDRGVRQALDVLEAEASNSPSGRAPRHRLTHLEMIHPDDISRFAELDVIADLQMSGDHVEPGPMQENVPILGSDRVNGHMWRLRDLHEAGAHVVLSSDYDVGSLSPLPAIERALTRGDQSLPDVASAIRAYTFDAAYLMRQENIVGSLEVGKKADMVVLDRDLLQIPKAQISNARVDMTFVEGELVWERGAALFADDFETGNLQAWEAPTKTSRARESAMGYRPE